MVHMKSLAGVPEEDAREIIRQVRDLYRNMNPFVKSFVPSASDVLRKIPPVARKYTVDDLIRLLEWAAKEGLLE